MAVLKCKMCGGDLNIIEGASTAECECCGSLQTVPKADDDKKLILFARANRLRAACDFDKAAGIYEAIVADFPEEAEAYWGLILCKYGIEYVDDPATGKKIPTCHRSSFDSVMKDPNVEIAQEYADIMARRLYREEAKQIEELRKQIVAVSSSEEPYDVFICYKETGFDGKRTLDSVLAQDIFDALTDKGYCVFFSRISLEDKLGTEFEPYIFAALNSAKIMLVIGTDYEYFTAVWVKNEWSRFLKLMAQDKSKHLIPCYKGIDAYDMPEEFARLQAQDLDKMGAIQDIVRGVQKLLPKQEQTVKETIVVQQTTPSTAPLLERAFMFLEDGDWANADKFCEQALNLEPKNAAAYLGKLMAELKVNKKEQLKNCTQPFDHKSNYQKTIRFADIGLKAELQGYIAHINTRNETAYKDEIYNDAIEKISNKTVHEYEGAIKLLETIPGWKDADEQIAICCKKIQEAEDAERLEREYKEELTRKEAKARAKRNKKIALIATPVACAIIMLAIVIFKVIIPNIKYNDAIAQMDAGEMRNAYEIFYDLGNYKDSTLLAQKCAYSAGEQAEGNNKTIAALMFGKAGDYLDAAEKSAALWDQVAKRRIIDVGCYYVVGVSDEGKVLLNGDNVIGGYADELMTWNNLIAIAGGDWVTAGLRKDGTVVAAGNGVSAVNNWRNIVSIEAGNDAIAGLKKDGTVICTDAALNKSVAKWSNIVAIDMESSYIIGLCADGRVLCSMEYWNMSDMTDIVQIAAGDQHCVGLRADGTVVAVGDGVAGTEVESWTDIVSVSAASFIIYGVKSDGTVVSTGDAIGMWGEYNEFYGTKYWSDVKSISSSYINAACIHKDGTVSAITHAGQADMDHVVWNLYKEP